MRGIITFSNPQVRHKYENTNSKMFYLVKGLTNYLLVMRIIADILIAINPKLNFVKSVGFQLKNLSE